jgi:hypothetical protein
MGHVFIRFRADFPNYWTNPDFGGTTFAVAGQPAKTSITVLCWHSTQSDVRGREIAGRVYFGDVLSLLAILSRLSGGRVPNRSVQ